MDMIGQQKAANQKHAISNVDICDTDRVQELCGTSGQQPIAVKVVGGRRQRNPIDQSREDNSKTRLFSCHICQKAFRRHDELKTHCRIHTGEKPYECKVCEKTFPRLDQLKLHGRTHTGEKPYECQVCEKTFSQLGQLKNHSRIHSGEKPYECRVCEKSFSQLCSLKAHSRIHTGEKPYECQVCKKTFSLLSTLRRHSRIHTGEKPYECRVCKKTFTHLSSFNRHSSTHPGQEPFECQVCKMTFSQLSNLKSHFKMQHTDENPYECQVCDKTFSHFSTYIRHCKTHPGQKPFECQECKKPFSHFEHLKNEFFEGTRCPPCSKIWSEGQSGNCSDEMDSSLEIKLNPDCILAADQGDCDIDNIPMGVDGRKEEPRQIKEEIIESEVDTTEFVTEDEHFVFLDEKIDIESEVDEAVGGTVAEDSSVTVKQEVEFFDS